MMTSGSMRDTSSDEMMRCFPSLASRSSGKDQGAAGDLDELLTHLMPEIRASPIPRRTPAPHGNRAADRADGVELQLQVRYQLVGLARTQQPAEDANIWRISVTLRWLKTSPGSLLISSAAMLPEIRESEDEVGIELIDALVSSMNEG